MPIFGRFYQEVELQFTFSSSHKLMLQRPPTQLFDLLLWKCKQWENGKCLVGFRRILSTSHTQCSLTPIAPISLWNWAKTNKVELTSWDLCKLLFPLSLRATIGKSWLKVLPTENHCVEITSKEEKSFRCKNVRLLRVKYQVPPNCTHLQFYIDHRTMYNLKRLQRAFRLTSREAQWSE